MELINEGAKKNKPRAICSKEVVVRGLVERCRVPQRGHDRLEISEQRGYNAGEAVCSRDKVTPLSLDSSFVKRRQRLLLHAALGRREHRHTLDTRFLLSFLFSKFPWVLQSADKPPAFLHRE